jgi:hypothetical protein
MELQELKEKQIAVIKRGGEKLADEWLAAVRGSRWYDELSLPFLLEDGWKYDVVVIYDYLDAMPNSQIAYLIAKCEDAAREGIIVHSEKEEVMLLLDALGFTTEKGLAWKKKGSVETASTHTMV